VSADRPVRRPSLVGSAVMTYGANAAAAVLSLVNVLIVARALGPVGRGDVAFLITVATMTGQLAGFSVQESVANLAGKEPEVRARLAGTGVVLSIVLGWAGALVVAGAVALVPAVGGEVDRTLLWLTLASLPLVIVRVYFSFQLQADYAFVATNAAWVSGPATTALTSAVLGLLGVLTVGIAIGAWIAGQALGVLILAVYQARHAGFGRPDAGLARRALSFGLKLHPTRFMDVATYRGDQWLVGSIAGSRELGVYSVAVAWAEALFYLPGVLALVQRPDLVRAGRERAVALVSQVFRVTVMLAAAAAIVLIVLAPVLCVWIFGDEFEGAVDQLRILALSACGISAVVLLSVAMIAQDRPLAATATGLTTFLAALALSVVLIPLQGGDGAAIARTLAYTLGGAGALLIFKRTLGGAPRDLIPRRTDLAWLSNIRRRRRAAQAEAAGEERGARASSEAIAQSARSSQK
jgi:O-antigen/teichoic acid export membrane protein